MADEGGGGEAHLKDDKSQESSSSSSSSSTLRNIVTSGIRHPGKNDVMFGRGGDTNYHIGNHRFRMLADEYKQSYREASRKEKAVIVQQLVDSWRAKDPPGRFLTRTDPSKGDDSLWHDVGTELALKKAAKILTERASSGSKGRGASKKRQAATAHADNEDPSGRQRPRQRQQQLQIQKQQLQFNQHQHHQLQLQYQQQLQQFQQQQHQPRDQPAQQLYQPFPSFQQYPTVASLPSNPSLPELPAESQALPIGVAVPPVGLHHSQQQVGESQHFATAMTTDPTTNVPSSVSRQLRSTVTRDPITTNLLGMIAVSRTPVHLQRTSGDLGIALEGQAGTGMESRSGAGIGGASEGKDDSPPTDAMAGDVVPTAASLAHVFYSSNSNSGSSEKPNSDRSSSPDGSK